MWKFLVKQIVRAWTELRDSEPDIVAEDPDAARAARFVQARIARSRLGLF